MGHVDDFHQFRSQAVAHAVRALVAHQTLFRIQEQAVILLKAFYPFLDGTPEPFEIRPRLDPADAVEVVGNVVQGFVAEVRV